MFEDFYTHPPKWPEADEPEHAAKNHMRTERKPCHCSAAWWQAPPATGAYAKTVAVVDSDSAQDSNISAARQECSCNQREVFQDCRTASSRVWHADKS